MEEQSDKLNAKEKEELLEEFKRHQVRYRSINPRKFDT